MRKLLGKIYYGGFLSLPEYARLIVAFAVFLLGMEFITWIPFTNIRGIVGLVWIILFLFILAIAKEP